jgi:hypothetical protein
MILNSWKEIASHLGCSVRTAQRFEQLGMPVRRPSGHIRSAVIAFTDEVDAWMDRCKARPLGPAASAAPDTEQVRRLRAEMMMLKERMVECRTRSAHLRQRAAQLRGLRPFDEPPLAA